MKFNKELFNTLNREIFAILAETATQKDGRECFAALTNVAAAHARALKGLPNDGLEDSKLATKIRTYVHTTLDS